MTRYLVQDIETIPESEVAGEWQPTQAEKDAANGDPFPPLWAHRVITIGMLELTKDLRPVKHGCSAGGLVALGKESDGEEKMIRRWNEVVGGNGRDVAQLVDYNGRGFDVPVLLHRAFRYGIPVEWYFGKLPDNRGQISAFSKTYRDRYGGSHLDVTELFTGNGAFSRPRLKHLAQLMGLPGKVGVDGSQVYSMWKTGSLAEIDLYCMQDVFQTAFIFMRYKLLAGELSLHAYLSSAALLYDYIAALEEHRAFVASIDKKKLLLD